MEFLELAKGFTADKKDFGSSKRIYISNLV